MNKILEGPIINSLDKNSDNIVIFLHGYGANGNDLIEIGKHWQQHLQKTLFSIYRRTVQTVNKVK